MSLVSQPRDGLAPRDQILWYAAKVLDEYSHTEVWDPAGQLTSASLQAAHEYAGRFLLELLQNAHDAHPSDRRDGRITIVVDADEGDHGTVYVANAGTPFTYEWMTKLCKFAQSPKVIGEGIGHKGVGFRSVLPVCEWPEIYSADPDGPPGNLDGYSFRFAQYIDLLTLTDGNAEIAQQAHDNFPPFQIPFPAETVPSVVRELAEGGHVTVVRLPLDGPSGQATALSLLNNLAGSEVPVLLFLDRIDSLTLKRRQAGQVHEDVLTRAERVLPGIATPPGDIRLARVDLGALGEWVVASASVDPDRLTASVQAALDEHLLTEKWHEFADAVVSVAIPLDFEVAGRIFTFLPMGEEARSPFHGHLNAPFFTKLDRTDLDPGHPLNDLLLTVAAEVAVSTAEALRSAPAPAARQWVSDVVCWTGPQRTRIAEAAQRHFGTSLSDLRFAPVVPTMGHEDGWASVRETVRWPGRELRVLIAERAAATGTCLLDPALGARRCTAWQHLGEWLGCPIVPEAERLAGLIEAVLAQMDRPSPYDSQDGAFAVRRRTRKKPEPARSAPPAESPGEDLVASQWAAVYADLAVLFGADGSVLQGRKLLVDEAGELRAANVPIPPGERRQGKRTSAFLPPTREEASVSVPAALRDRLFYLHPAVAELLPTLSRAFLTSSALAYGYEIRSLLDHVRRVLAGTEGERIHREALRFVFTIDQRGQISRGMAVNDLGLRVPTRSGRMHPAGSAVFGADWPDRHGTDLAIVLAEAGNADRELASLAERIVDPAPDLVRKGDARAQWAAFLTRIGVVDGLPVYVPAGTLPKIIGYQLGTEYMAQRFRLPAPVAEQWARHLGHLPSIGAAHPQTEYISSRKPVWVAGQAIAERLSTRGRAAYARLILHGLSQWPASRLHTTWERDRTGSKDPRRVPTPLAAFLFDGAWLSAAPHAGTSAFARPADLWHFPLGSDEAEPGFAALIARPIRDTLDRQPSVLAVLRNAGLGVWNDVSHAARLVRHLGEVAAEGKVADSQWDQFLRMYRRAWTGVANPSGPSLSDAESLWIVLRQGGGFEVSRCGNLAESSTNLYLARPSEGLHLRLLDELEFPVLLIEGDLDRVKDQLDSVMGALVQTADEDAVSVAPSGLSEGGDLLADKLPWMVVLVAAAADHGRGLTMQERQFDDLAHRLRIIQVRSYGTLGLTIFDHPAELPDSRCGILAQRDDADPSVLAPVPLGELSGVALAILAEEVSVAVHRRDLQERVRAAVLDVLRGGGDQPDPGDEDLSRALRLTVAQIKSTRERLSGGLATVMGRLYPVLVHWVGKTASDAAADAAREISDFADLENALSLAGDLPVTVDHLIGVARAASSLRDLRDTLGLDFASFNDTLRTLSPEYSPFSRQPEHEQALRGYLNIHRATLIDRLRGCRLTVFDSHRLQPDWPELTSFGWIKIPADWGQTIEEASSMLLDQLVRDAFARRLGTRAPDIGTALQPQETAASANQARIIRAAPDLARLARAWTDAHKAALPPILASENPAREVVDLFATNGLLDFRQLTDDDIPAWLDVAGQWPTGMPVTSKPGVAGITGDQLRIADSAETALRRERERRRRIVRVGATDIDVGVGATNLANLIEALQANMDANPSLTDSPTRTVRLAPQPARHGGAAGGAGGGGWRDPMAGLSDEQRNAIGFAGEWFAYHWLLGHYPEANESSWVSTYRRHVFAGDPGNDDLGFDFRVERARDTLMFEIKANRDEPGVFMLTHREMSVAQRHARDERWRLLIVPYVFDPFRCKVMRLPNPFDPKFEDRFSSEGKGIQYRYRPALRFEFCGGPC